MFLQVQLHSVSPRLAKLKGWSNTQFLDRNWGLSHFLWAGRWPDTWPVLSCCGYEEVWASFTSAHALVHTTLLAPAGKRKGDLMKSSLHLVLVVGYTGDLLPFPSWLWGAQLCSSALGHSLGHGCLMSRSSAEALLVFTCTPPAKCCSLCSFHWKMTRCSHCLLLFPLLMPGKTPCLLGGGRSRQMYVLLWD